MPLLPLLQESRASDAFREALREFAERGVDSDRIRYTPGSPRVKVVRTLTKMLEAFPDLAVEAVEVDGSSGCEFYRGELRIRADGGERSVRFEWNCKWKAEQQGWTDYFGLPDQIRAARTFGYNCFRQWDEQPTATASQPYPA